MQEWCTDVVISRCSSFLLSSPLQLQARLPASGPGYWQQEHQQMSRAGAAGGTIGLGNTL